MGLLVYVQKWPLCSITRRTAKLFKLFYSFQQAHLSCIVMFVNGRFCRIYVVMHG